MTDVRVVGVALLRDTDGAAQVLAGRRSGPDGGWELPGGKCEPGEDLGTAAVREIAEELGCEVRVVGRLSGVAPIRPGLTLEVVLARLVRGEPVPLEHEELRWLGADALGSVAWLPADLPFLPELGRRLDGTVGGPA